MIGSSHLKIQKRLDRAVSSYIFSISEVSAKRIWTIPFIYNFIYMNSLLEACLLLSSHFHVDCAKYKILEYVQGKYDERMTSFRLHIFEPGRSFSIFLYKIGYRQSHLKTNCSSIKISHFLWCMALHLTIHPTV